MDELNIVCEPSVAYLARGFEASECNIIENALSILKRKLGQEATGQHPRFESPAILKDYLRLKLAPLSVEAFGVVWTDIHHRLLTIEELFRGTLGQTSVYPREVARRALALNASCAVLYHNHPSGSAHPSRADELLTQTLKSALALVDVRVIDHLIVGADRVFSMAENGYM